jgi:cytochrome P450
MDAYIPPFPERHARPLSTAELLRRSHHSFISIWEDKAFEYQTMATRLLSRQVVICNSPDTVRQAFVTDNASFERKSPQMRNILRPLVGDGLFISEGETWKTRRRIVAPAVHAQLMPQFAPIMVEAAMELRQRWSALPPGSRVDALSEMAQLTADIICRAIFGRELGRLNAQAIVESFSEYQRQIDTVNILSLLGLPDMRPGFLTPAPVRRSTARIVAILDEVIGSYRGRGERDDSSLIGRLLDARDETGAPLSHEAIRNEAAVIFMAGHETTANCLAWSWFLLSQAAWADDRVGAEIGQVTGGRPPGFQDLGRLVYTRAVIEEAMRLYPPIPLLTRQASRGEKIRSREVKAGAIVAVIPWLLHRHRLYWDKPDHFMPERFLPDAPPPDKYVYLPFSVGPRVCAGLSFGLTEAILCLATLAQVFRLRLAPGASVEPVARLSLRPGNGLKMIVERRVADA